MVDEWLVFIVLFHPFNGEFMVILVLLIMISTPLFSMATRRGFPAAWQPPVHSVNRGELPTLTQHVLAMTCLIPPWWLSKFLLQADLNQTYLAVLRINWVNPML